MDSYINILIHYRFYGDLPMIPELLYQNFEMEQYSSSMSSFNESEYKEDNIYYDYDLNGLTTLLETNA